MDGTHLYLSFGGANTTVPGLGAVQDEDVVYDAAGTWSVYFDGTAQGLTADAADVDAFSLDGSAARPAPPGPGAGALRFSTWANANPPGVGGTADDADIYYWNGTSYIRDVDVTAPPYSLPAGANVDGYTRVDATHFYLSFSNDTNVAVPGLGNVQDEDVVYWNDGSWSVYFDGTAHGLGGSANLDVDGISVDAGTLYFSTAGNTNPPGVVGTADDADVYSWNGTSYSRDWDATANGVADNPGGGRAGPGGRHAPLPVVLERHPRDGARARQRSGRGRRLPRQRHLVGVLRRLCPRPGHRQRPTWTPSTSVADAMSRTGRRQHPRRACQGRHGNEREAGHSTGGRSSRFAGGAVAVAGGMTWAGRVLAPEAVYAAAGDPDLYLAGTDGWMLPAPDAGHRAVPPRQPGPGPVHDLHLRVPQRHRV